MARPITLGMINVLLRNQPLAERRAMLLALVAEAGKSGCQIVLLPEFADHHVTPEAGEARKRGVAEYHRTVGLQVDSPWMQEIAALAREYRCVVIPDVLLLEGDRAYNSAVVFGPDGQSLGQYRKTHLAPGECETVAPGEAIEPVETPFGRIGLFICYDINFPEITRCHELRGADLLLWTSMRQVESEDALFRMILPARALEHGLPLGVATYVSARQKVIRRPMTGTIFNPFGQVIAGGLLTQGVVRGTVDLDERSLTRRRWGEPEWVDQSRYTGRRRRPDLYGPLVQPLSAEEADPDREPVAGEFPEMNSPVM